MKRPAVIAALAAAEIMSSLAFDVVGQRSLSAMSGGRKSSAARPGSYRGCYLFPKFAEPYGTYRASAKAGREDVGGIGASLASGQSR